MSKMRASSLAFNQAVGIGFLIGTGVLMLFFPFEMDPLHLLCLILFGVVFAGIVFNLLVMILVSLIRTFTKRLSLKFTREQFFIAINFGCLPLSSVIVVRLWCMVVGEESDLFGFFIILFMLSAFLIAQFLSGLSKQGF